MKNRRSGWRYPYEERRDNGREWRVRSSNQREETAVQHQHNSFRDEGRAVHATGWGDTERIGDAPSSGRAVHATGWGDTERIGYAPSSGRAVHATGWGDTERIGDAPSSGRAVHATGWGDTERVGYAPSSGRAVHTTGWGDTERVGYAPSSGRAVHATGWGDTERIGDAPSSGRAVHATGWGDTERIGDAPSSGRAVHATGWGDTERVGDAPSSGRAVHATGWGDTEHIGCYPSSTAPSKRRLDIKETERKCEDGWGSSPVDNNVSADVTSAWEALATANLSDWSKPPQIESVEHWDDTGAKETWEFVISERLPANNPDLYLEKNIDWNSRIPADLLAFVDDRCRHRKASPPRPGSPVLLGLETLDQNCGDTQPPPRNGNMMKSKENLQQGGGSGSWGDSKPGQRRTKQQVNERVPGEKLNTLVRDDYIDRGRKRRGDKDEHHRKPRFRGAHRY